MTLENDRPDEDDFEILDDFFNGRLDLGQMLVGQTRLMKHYLPTRFERCQPRRVRACSGTEPSCSQAGKTR